MMRILIVDDDDILRITMRDDLEEAGHQVNAVGRVEEALPLLDGSLDAIICDIQLPGLNGMELLPAARRSASAPCVIMITGFGTVETAVKAIREGAYDYLTKPFSNDELLAVINRIEELRRLKNENLTLRARLQEEKDQAVLTGRSPVINDLRNRIKMLAQTDSPVLIQGETGTGKDLAARMLHNHSPRGAEPFVKISCAIYSPTVLESELFGYEKGAFTGANQARAGRFEIAGNGTVYIDEIDDIPLELQVKLLHVIEDGTIERMGSTRPIPLQARVVAASKRDLKRLVEEGRFRNDLYFRLNVHLLELPVLRDYLDDIPYLIAHFLLSFGHPGDAIQISPPAMQRIREYSWPGNVRELRNFVERLLISRKGREITTADLPFLHAHPEPAIGSETNLSFDTQMDRFERHLLEIALKQTNGNQLQAAQNLQMKPSTFRDRCRKHALL